MPPLHQPTLILLYCRPVLRLHPRAACRPCCVGLTDQWVHQRVSDEHYALWHAALRDQVRVQDANAAAAAAGAADAIDGGAVNGRAVQVIVAARDYRCSDSVFAPPFARCALACPFDTFVHTHTAISPPLSCLSSPPTHPPPTHRLMLHRHWTLHDALVFSSYVAPRLQTWRQAGRDSVALLLARMGIPLEQARTRFGAHALELAPLPCPPTLTLTHTHTRYMLYLLSTSCTSCPICTCWVCRLHAVWGTACLCSQVC